jgi:hypothetical protein
MQTKFCANQELWGRCYKTFYGSNLPPFHGNTDILCYKAIVPWKFPRNGSKLLQYFNPRKVGLNYYGNLPPYCFITLAPSTNTGMKLVPNNRQHLQPTKQVE